ncbi:hypothetical protein V1511DRAFT_278471 [Dipodascopsis uninucleata]
MRVLLAAEDSGSLKDVRFPFGANTSQQNSIQPEISTFARAGRSSYVQKMTVVKLANGKEYICVARKGGIIQLHDLEEPHLLFAEWKDTMQESDDAFIGLEYVSGKLSSCTATGKLIMRDLDASAEQSGEFYTLLGYPISSFKVHPKQPNIVAYGGKERELEVSTIENVRGSEGNDGNWTIIPFPATGRVLSRRKLWKAKNVKNDELDLRVPVWVSDIRFLDVNRESTTDWRIVVSTRFGHIRVYETKMSRKPIINVEVGEHPLIALSPSMSDNDIIYCDTHSTTARFSLLNCRKEGHYAGNAGSVLCLDSYFPAESNKTEDSTINSGQELTPLLASGGLDRFLRVYDMATRNQLAKIYLGTKITAACIIDGSSGNSSTGLESDVGEDIEDVNDEKSSGTKRRKIKREVDSDDSDEHRSRQKKRAYKKVVDEDEDEEDSDDVWNMLEQIEEDSSSSDKIVVKHEDCDELS